MINEFIETLHFTNFCTKNPDLYYMVRAQGSDKLTYAFFRLVLCANDFKARPYLMGKEAASELLRIFNMFPDDADAHALKFVLPRG